MSLNKKNPRSIIDGRNPANQLVLYNIYIYIILYIIYYILYIIYYILYMIYYILYMIYDILYIIYYILYIIYYIIASQPLFQPDFLGCGFTHVQVALGPRLGRLRFELMDLIQ